MERRWFIIIDILLDFMAFTNFNSYNYSYWILFCHSSPPLQPLLSVLHQCTQQAHVQLQTQQPAQSQAQPQRKQQCTQGRSRNRLQNEILLLRATNPAFKQRQRQLLAQSIQDQQFTKHNNHEQQHKNKLMYKRDLDFRIQRSNNIQE